MHEYDTALKTFLRRGRESLLAVSGTTFERWHNVELPEVKNRRVDLLGESADGNLTHIELQSTNDSTMNVRMLEYCAAVFRRFGQIPDQIVLYVGEAPLRMTCDLSGKKLSFDCTIIDIRELEDNIIAVLASVRDQRAAVKEILGRIAAADSKDRADALTGFLILAGLRQLGEAVEKEANRMPLLDDIMDHPVLGREFKRGRQRAAKKAWNKAGNKDATTEN